MKTALKKMHIMKSIIYFQKSIYPLWAKRKSNMVLLTAREHFFAHLLLVKIYENEPEKYIKMVYAAHRFQKSRHADYKISSREYETLKKELAKATFLQFKNTKQSKEHIEKRINSLKETRQKYKIHWSAEHREKTKKWFEENKHTLSAKQKEGWTDEVREKFSKTKKEYFANLKKDNPNYWKKHQKEVCNTDKVKQNMSKAKKGKLLYVNKQTNEKHYFVQGEQPEDFILVNKKFIPKLSMEEVKIKYREYKNNGGTLKWNEFQKELKNN